MSWWRIGVYCPLGENIRKTDKLSIFDDFQRSQKRIGSVVSEVTPQTCILENVAIFFGVAVIELVQRSLMLYKLRIVAVPQLCIVHGADAIPNLHRHVDLHRNLLIKGSRLYLPLRRVIDDAPILLIIPEGLILLRSIFLLRYGKRLC